MAVSVRSCRESDTSCSVQSFAARTQRACDDAVTAQVCLSTARTLFGDVTRARARHDAEY